MIAGITEQLSKYCECIGDVTERDVKEIIDLISMYTCWTNEPCDTFLLGNRKEVIELPPCLDCPYEFEPFYHPFDEETFEFTVIHQNGMEIETNTAEYVYNPASGKFLVDTGLPSCKCMPANSCTPCDDEYKLVVTYQAGYEALPDCLLPVFCNLLDVIQAKNKCDCDDCGCDTEEQIKYATGDVVTAALETDLGKVLVEQYKRQIALISLCEERSMWGIVV